MSTFRIKQLSGPAGNNKGAAIIFDNGVPRWSADLSSALLLPKGSTEERPVAADNGMLRYNTSTELFEKYENGEWSNFVSKVAFSDLIDGPGPLQAGKSVRVNTEGDKLEFYTPLKGFIHFRVKVVFNNLTGGTPAGLDELPEGWNGSISGNNITITHNLNLPLAQIYSSGKMLTSTANTYGLDAPNAYALRPPTNVNMVTFYDRNKVYISGVTANGMGADNAAHGYIEFYFVQ